MKIYYVTGNKMKIDFVNMIFKDHDIEVIQEKMETPEIQSLDCEEVSKYSACYACDKLKKPVLKNDSGIIIPALNGFPGALTKYAEETLKAEGFLKLLEGKDRSCYWVEVLTYKDVDKEPVCFTSYTYGKISDEIHEGRGQEFDKIFIPDNDDRTFSCMSYEEHLACFDKKAYFDLLNYLKNVE